jgi:murein tripeptide amidase MpaA
VATRVRFDRFYSYADLNETLAAWASEFPQLLRVESIGTSYEGREILLVTVTNLETGPPEEKPAVFVHAQIHAMEFTAPPPRSRCSTGCCTTTGKTIASRRPSTTRVLRRAPGHRTAPSRPRRRTLPPLERRLYPVRSPRTDYTARTSTATGVS